VLHKFFDHEERKHDLQQDFHLLMIHQDKRDLQEELLQPFLRKALAVQDKLLCKYKFFFKLNLKAL